MANPARTKKQLGYFKFGSVLFSTTLSLFIVGLFGIILIQASSLTKMIRENIEIQVFLDKELSQKKLDDLRKNLAQRPFVLNKEDSLRLRFVSNKEAAETFIKNTGEEELYTMFWINEFYDANDPDTYFEKV